MASLPISAAVELSDEALFDHELGERGEAPVLLQAAVIIEFAAMPGDIQPVQQLFVAARAVQRVAQGQALGVAVFVDQLEQLDDAARRDLHAFKVVEPDALARKAEIEHDFAVMQTLEALLDHDLPAGGAGGRFHRERGASNGCASRWAESKL